MSSSISKGLLWLAGLFLFVSGFHTQDPLETDMFDYDHEHQEPELCQNMSISITDFAFDLYHHFCSWSQTSNILFSPVSIATAFTMLSLGTKGNTHKQILEGLKFNLTKMPEDLIHECFHHFLSTFHQPQLTTGSSFFIDQSLKLVHQFKEEIEEMYHSDIMLVNFTDNMATRQINNYLEQKTHGEIVEAMKDLEKDTAFVLMNYIAFYGTWHSEFYAEHTVEEDFYVDSGTTVKVPMSHCRGQFFLHRELELDSWVMVHHYVGDTTAFFFLPDLGKMRHLETALNHRHFENILRNMALRSADVYFPKLSISETYDLKTMLTQMGITQVFSNEADLTGVTEDAPLKLSKSIHKAMLTFDNKEMEVLGGINLDDMTLWFRSFTIMFNRPFILIIKDRSTNIPFFMGKIVDPTKQQLISSISHPTSLFHSMFFP